MLYDITQLKFRIYIFKFQVHKEYAVLCEIIHISLICMNKCAQQLIPMIKSLLHHRQNPLHFHFIVDSVSERTISELFSTWDLPDGMFYILYLLNFFTYRIINASMQD